MGSLSIIVPHRNNDQRLESTLVSLLEQQQASCEIVVAHDGSYADPYDIGDEVRLLACPQRTLAGRLNHAAQNASSDIIAIIRDGTIVEQDWSEGAIEAFEDPTVASVSVGGKAGSQKIAGITPLARCDSNAIRGGKPDRALGNVQYAGPSLSCGLYRRSSLIALGGWDEGLSLGSADIELAWLMQSLGMNCQTLAGNRFHTEEFPRQDTTGLNEAAQLCVAYGITSSGPVAATMAYLSSIFAVGAARASAWSRGLRGGAVTRAAIARLNRAMSEAEAAEELLPFPTAGDELRRAA